MFLSSQDIQLGRGEPIKDTARVLGRMVHGIIIRTFAQQDVVDLAKYSDLPVINALTDDEHPCQILADLLTVREKLGTWEGQKFAFVGDGFSNMTRSWMWAAKHLGFGLSIASPKNCQPPAQFLEKLDCPLVSFTEDPREAVKEAMVINTDVWLSMGQEEQKEKEAEFAGFELNSELLSHAANGHIVLHCLPAYRGKEISDEILEMHASSIFQQAENRLHAQKAVLVALARKS
jgi:ornithine carbamoyltransferase